MIRFKETATQLIVFGDQPSEIAELCEAFKVRPKGYFFSPKYEQFRISGGKEGWDGYVRHMQRTGPKEARILRGRRDEVLHEAGIMGLTMDKSGLFPTQFPELTLADISPKVIESKFELDDFQRQSILQLLKSSVGIVKATVSAGKTAIFAGAAAMVKKKFPDARFLYITPAERLVRQVTPEMRRFLPGWDIGQFGGGSDKAFAEDMVVCTLAMVRRHLPRLIREGWTRRFMCLLFDEVHHCISPSAQEILLSISAFFRFGASDSIKHDDPEKHGMMKGLIGNIVHTIDVQPHIQSGRIARPHVYFCPAGKSNKFDLLPYQAVPNSKAWCLVEGQWRPGTYTGPVYQVDARGQVKMEKKTELVENELGVKVQQVVEVPVVDTGFHSIRFDGSEEISKVESRWCLLQRVHDQAIVNNGFRNDLIVKWARHFSSRGLCTLIVCTRTLHIYILESLLKQYLDDSLVRICYGWSTSKQRDDTFEYFKSTPGCVLVTPLAKEGVSIPEIRAAIVADSVSNPELANQIIGRAIRRKLTGENSAEIVWFHETQHAFLRRNSRRIAHVFKLVHKYEVYDPSPDVDVLLATSTS